MDLDSTRLDVNIGTTAYEYHPITSDDSLDQLRWSLFQVTSVLVQTTVLHWFTPINMAERVLLALTYRS